MVNEKCQKCQWWVLLQEVRDEMEEIIECSKQKGRRDANYYNCRKEAMRLFNEATYKVVKRHWEKK